MAIIRNNYRLRLGFILLGFLLLFLIVIVRLYLIQIHRKSFFKHLAEQQYCTELTVQPPRAVIHDRNGVQLTINTEAISTFILPHQFDDSKRAKKILKKHFKHAYKQIKKNPNRKFLWLDRNLSKKQLALVRKLNSKDIHFIEEPHRFYPHKELSPLLGFTDIDNNGLAGIELQFNEKLKGTPTKYSMEKDARSGSFYIKKNVVKQGKTGTPITLTIDSNLQFFAYEELRNTVKQYEAQSGAVVIMQPETGEVLAMASYPAINPNKSISKIAKTKHTAMTECYELGSIIKSFSTLAALEEKVVTIDEEIDCEGKVAFIDGFRVENWKSLGISPFWEVVQRSSNVGIAKVTKRLGNKFYDHLKKLGLGNTTGIEFPGERTGFVNHPFNWSRPSLIVMSFGYEMNGTILQLAKAFSIISNGGYDVTPTLLKRDRPVEIGKTLYSQEAIEQTKTVLETIGKNHGIEGFRIMGKTGTARCVKDGRYTNREHVYSFGGMIEKDGYKRVIVTFINRPKKSYLWASQLTGPLFKRIAEKMVIHDLVKRN